MLSELSMEVFCPLRFEYGVCGRTVIAKGKGELVLSFVPSRSPGSRVLTSKIPRYAVSRFCRDLHGHHGGRGERDGYGALLPL